MAIVHFFERADLGPQPPNNRSNSTSKLAEHKSLGQAVGHSMADDNTTASILLATNNIIYLLYCLITKAPRDLGLAKSLNLIELQLNALMHSAIVANNSSYLPKKGNILPNQHTWLKTTIQMGENCWKKHCHRKVDSTLTAQHIGEPNCKQAANDNPYRAREQPDKCAKPNVCSATTNT